MPRVKRGKTHVARRKRLHALSKGYRWGRRNTIRLSSVAVTKAGAHAYVGRKVKKRAYRGLWHIKINAAVRQYDLSYSRFVKLLKDAKIALDGKVLAELADKHPQVFEALVKEVKK